MVFECARTCSLMLFLLHHSETILSACNHCLCVARGCVSVGVMQHAVQSMMRLQCCHSGSKGCCHTPKVHNLRHLFASCTCRFLMALSIFPSTVEAAGLTTTEAIYKWAGTSDTVWKAFDNRVVVYPMSVSSRCSRRQW